MAEEMELFSSGELSDGDLSGSEILAPNSEEEEEESGASFYGKAKRRCVDEGNHYKFSLCSRNIRWVHSLSQ